ncbi:MAG: MBL fold metallo-hydrolase [Sphaerochaeta sp.]
MVRYAVLGSGSSGNSYVFFDGTVSVLIDQGFSVVELQRRLQSLTVDLFSIGGVCVTHLHPDHAKGIGTIARKLNVPIYLNEQMVEKEPVVFSKLAIPESCLRMVRPMESFTIGSFILSCFETSHDSGGSVGWHITHEGNTLMVLTDTGCYTAEQLSLAKNTNILFLEANYDDTMLSKGPYPYFLKKRISGDHGHLSNAQALDFLRESEFGGNHVYFIHLSDVNNNPSLLFDVARQNVKVPFTVCEKGKCYGGLWSNYEKE